jgi:hypothetical protein
MVFYLWQVDYTIRCLTHGLTLALANALVIIMSFKFGCLDLLYTYRDSTFVSKDHELFAKTYSYQNTSFEWRALDWCQFNESEC